ncbi:hypothetical protein ACIA8K_35090 [Catenuloplanes sp. NPDC051500]|uniref:hypothetical protein n=1 Tax=Catenuloplanes sp. NPDC051500 TaxID=3363959 RepID=UPI0037B191F4
MGGIRLALDMTFSSTPHGTDEQFEEFLDAVQEHLDALGVEVQIAARLAERTVDFAAEIETDSFEVATNKILSDVRTALHAAGCSTAGWPRFEATKRGVRELQNL